MISFRWIDDSTNNAANNMAIDEAILHSVSEGLVNPTIRVYQWDPSTVSIGRNQSLTDEVDLSELYQRGFEVVRRSTGGGAVFHSAQGELTYSIVVNESFLQSIGAEMSYYFLGKGIIAGLIDIGLDVETDAIHCPSLFVNRKKISGNAQVRRHGVILQHGTILLDYDPEEMYSVLKIKGNRSKSRMVKSVFAHVTTLKRELGEIPPLTQLKEKILRGYEKAYQCFCRPGKLTPYERNLAKELAERKYGSTSWTQHGKNPFSMNDLTSIEPLV